MSFPGPYPGITNRERPYKGDTLQEERQTYLHLYFNLEKYSDNGNIFNQKLNQLQEELLSGHRIPEHEKDYRRYFEIKETPKRGLSLTVKQKTADDAHECYGFFVYFPMKSGIRLPHSSFTECMRLWKNLP